MPQRKQPSYSVQSGARLAAKARRLKNVPPAELTERLGADQRLIALTRGMFAIVDLVDFEKINSFNWYALKTGKMNTNFYAARDEWDSVKMKKKFILMHRDIINPEIRLHCDHINGNTLDNRRENLREVTAAENFRAHKKKKPGCTSGFRGISKDARNGRWNVSAFKDGKRFWVGRFESEVDAAKAWDTKAIELGFSKEALNFPL